MNELPVFISYRQVDGSDLAFWLHESLYGQSRILRESSLYVPTIISPYLDRAAPAVDNWKELHERELDRARALVVVCTPAAMYEFTEEMDWFYYELRWWVKHRSKTAPILVSSDDHGLRYVPDILRTRWPMAQLVKVDRRVISRPVSLDLTASLRASTQASIQSILGGIAYSVGDLRAGLQPEPWHAAGMPNIPGVFAWEKDRQYRYINVNENYARAAGYDSPQSMLGKTDEEMPWRSLVDLFRAGDYQVMSGTETSRLCVQEMEVMADRVADILVTESALRDRRGEIVGLTGCFFDITGRELTPRRPLEGAIEDGISLGEEFGNETLSKIEVEVFRGMVRSLSRNRIASSLSIGSDEVGTHLVSIRRKLQGSTDGEVIASAVRAGLPLELFGPRIEERNVEREATSASSTAH